MIFDEAALFLHHQNVLKSFGETADAAFLKWPDQGDLVDPQPDLSRHRVRYSEIGERLTQIEIGLAGRGNAQSGRAAIEHDPVERIGARERRDGCHLGAVQATFLFHRRVRPADAQAAGRHLEIGRRDDLDPGGIAVDRSRTLHRFRDRLEAHPAP